jgi:uncharacterized membrane protein YdbT with pleckstrin-like domain
VAYPDKVLADGEQVVEHLHPHWITLVPATFWFIVICGAGGAGIYACSGHHTAGEVGIIAIIVVGFILLCWLTFRPWAEWRSTHYVFTTHRVLIRRGVLKHTGRDISLQRINDVGFTQSLWDRMVGAGTLKIESAGDNGQEDLHNIPKSDQQQQLLNRLIEQDSDRRARGSAPGYQPPGPQTPGYAGPAQPGYPPPPPPGQYPPTQQYPPQQ